MSDSSYASLDPSVRNNDPLLGQRISDAIAEQMKIVRAKYPNAQFVTDLWQEGARLMQEGYLKIPPEVTLVWADTGYGDMQDGGKVGAGQGMYFHVAMMNGQANQLSEMVSVKIIQAEIGRYIKAGATSYFLVNTSDIRPVAMTTRAVMEMAWGGVPVTSNRGSAERCRRRRRRCYYRRWATEEFGAKSADALAKDLQGVFCCAVAARAVRTAATDLGRQCSAASAALQQCSARRWRSALSHRGAPADSRLPQRAPGDRDSQPVAQVDAAARVLPQSNAEMRARVARSRHQGLRRRAAALGCGVEGRRGRGEPGRSGTPATTTRKQC